MMPLVVRECTRRLGSGHRSPNILQKSATEYWNQEGNTKRHLLLSTILKKRTKSDTQVLALSSCHWTRPELQLAQSPGGPQARLAVVPVQEKQRERAHDQEEEDPDPEAGVVLDRLERQSAGRRFSGEFGRRCRSQKAPGETLIPLLS